MQDAAPYSMPVSGYAHKSSHGADVIQGIILAVILSVYTFTVGTDIDDGNSQIQFFKLILLAITFPAGTYKLVVSQAGFDGIKYVVLATKYIWLFIAICGLLIPFSYYPDISLNKFAITVIGLMALQINLAYYVSRNYCHGEETWGRQLLATHMLLFIAALSVFGLLSLVFLRDAVDPREYATGGLIHPNLMASALGIGLLHAAMFRAARGSFAIGSLPRIAKIVIFVAGLPVFVALSSRGATISLLISAVVAILLSRFRQNLATAFAFVLVFALLIWFLDGQDVLVSLERDQNETLSTLTGRTEVWDAVYYDMSVYRILTGFGYAISFPSLYLSLNYGIITGTHDAYLQALTSGGIFGLFALTMYIVTNLYRSVRESIIDRKRIYFLACSIFIATNSLSESLFGAQLTIAFALFICAQICSSLPSEEKLFRRAHIPLNISGT